MFDDVLSLLLGRAPPPRGGDPLKLAVAALLVEAARMDDSFDPAERLTLLRLLRQRFGLDAAAAERLLDAAEEAEAEAAGAYCFTKIVIEKLTQAERIALIEMMWEIAFADGVVSADEDALLRRVAGLIDVDDRSRGEARERVRTRRAGPPE